MLQGCYEETAPVEFQQYAAMKLTESNDAVHTTHGGRAQPSVV